LFDDDEYRRIEEAFKDSQDDFRQSGRINLGALFDRYEIEQIKFGQMIRLFIQIRKRMQKFDLSFIQLIKQYGISVNANNQVGASEFIQMSERLGIFRSTHKDDTQYLYEEYGQFDEQADKPFLEKRDERGQGGVPAHKINEQLEDQKRAETYFLLQEIETDFNFFEKEIIPEVEE